MDFKEKESKIKNAIVEGHKLDKTAQNYLTELKENVSEVTYVKMQTAADSSFQNAATLLEEMSNANLSEKEKKKFDELNGFLYYASDKRFGKPQKAPKLKFAGNIAAILFLVIGMSIFSPTITGKVVQNMNPKSGKIIGIIIIILSITGIVLLMRKNILRKKLLRD